MAHDLTATPHSPGLTTVTVPDGGDARTAASVDVPFGSIWNAVMWIYGVLTGSIAQGLSINGFIGTIGHDITADGDLVATHDVIADNNVHAFQNINADGNLQVNGSGAVQGLFGVGGNASVGGNLGVTGNLSVGGTVSAHIVRPLNVSSGGSAVLGSNYYYPSTGTGGTLTLPTATTAGEFIEVRNDSTTHSVSVRTPGGTLLANLIAPDGSDWISTSIPAPTRAHATFMYTGSAWILWDGSAEYLGG